MMGSAAALAIVLAAAGFSGVDNPSTAKNNWMLHCQGCHLPDGSGSADGAPSMIGIVSRFLSVEGGREYVGKVPGVANAGLDDAALAELVNWMLQTYDKEHLPANFKPYTAREIGALRERPYIVEAADMRQQLLEKLRSMEAAGENR